MGEHVSRYVCSWFLPSSCCPDNLPSAGNQDQNRNRNRPEKMMNEKDTVTNVGNKTGVACDIPSHSYQFSFAPNPNWSNVYAPGHEIQKYLQDVAERFGATRFIKLSHQVEECVWDDREKKWHIKVKNLLTGEVFTDSAHVLITARGQLSEPRWPDIEGIEKFEGKKMHSGAWDKR